MAPATPPLIALVGAPCTGAAPLAEALRQRLAAGAATLCPSTALLDALTCALATTQSPSPPPPFSHNSGAVAAALELHQRAQLTLLMGLDEAPPSHWQVPPGTSHGMSQEACDALLRAALANAGVVFHVVYGQGKRRVDTALNAIKSIAFSAYPESARAGFDTNINTEDANPRRVRLRAWDCEKCSDPECEHRLFTALVAAQAGDAR
ncbi:hypothetical protein [Acidovorax sp.]|uniref:hypothetical protein n=1 Tax=Acidovorax sp. TaxID=1872122 RepID=UPI003919BB85